jgi:hypothetical protein
LTEHLDSLAMRPGHDQRQAHPEHERNVPQALTIEKSPSLGDDDFRSGDRVKGSSFFVGPDRRPDQPRHEQASHSPNTLEKKDERRAPSARSPGRTGIVPETRP